MRIRIRLLDSVVEIDTAEPAAGRLLSLLWGAMRTEERVEPARVYEVTHDGEEWLATADGEVEAVHETLWGVTNALRYRMLELCEERLARFVTLHAAAVSRGRDLVLLAGGSGAGKTTLTLALLRAGWTYFSDDVVPVSIDTGLVHPFPKPLGIKDPATWATLPPSFQDATGLAAPGGSFLAPADLWTVADEPVPPRALVFPKFTPGGSLAVERVSPGRAAAAASAYVRSLDPQTLGVLKRLCAASRSARLVYGSSEDAVTALGDLLDLAD